MSSYIVQTETGEKLADGMETVPGKMYEYYHDLELLPTFGDLKTEEQLEKFGRIRVDLFDNKLHMPRQMINGSSLMHVGPDSGEHSLVFAKWGADLTLVEPNPLAASQINAYFDHFKLQDRLKTLHQTDIAGYNGTDKFDIVDAEGFIYTLQPWSDWLSVFNGALKKDGLMVISYYARLGGFFELCLRAFHRAVAEITGEDTETSAWMLYEAKWNSIPHDKPFKYWVLDMLDNPYVRARYFIDPASLCREAEKQGFSLYSSWPQIRDPLSTYWHKSETRISDEMFSPASHLNRSALSHFTGRKMYITTPDIDELTRVVTILDDLVDLVDSLIDGLNDDVLQRCTARLQELQAILPGLDMVTDTEGTRQEVLSLLGKLEKVMQWIRDGNIKDFVNLTNNDLDFIHIWGLPTHFAVYRNTGNAEK